MSDPSQPGQPSQEQLRAYVEQLRAADPSEIVVQAYSMLGTGAETKLGRPDARTLIDALSGMVEAAAGRLEAGLVERMRAGIRQLQMAQVQSEGHSDEAAGGEPAAPSAGVAVGDGPDAADQRSPAEGPASAGPPAGGPEGQRMTDRLWIPGRGQPPPRRPG